MINQIEDQLKEFVPSEMWHPTYYQRLLEFLEKPENTKLFFWVENEQLIINYNVPNSLSGKNFGAFFKFKFKYLFPIKYET